MIDAIIFDLDGIIVDGEPVHLTAANKVLSAYGFHLTEEENNEYIGTSTQEYWLRLKAKFSLNEDLQSLINKWTGFLEDEYPNAPLIPGFMKFLWYLSGKNYKLGVASSTDISHIKKILENIGIIDRFHVIASSQECGHGKPHPDVYLLAARKLRVSPKDCIAIEDSMNGILSAKKAGMMAIAIPTRYTQNQDFSHADLILDSFAELDEDVLMNLSKKISPNC